MLWNNDSFTSSEITLESEITSLCYVAHSYKMYFVCAIKGYI